MAPEGSLDNAAAAKLLKDHAVMITRNVNPIALKPYLLQNNCITLEEAKQFQVESPRSESNLKLVDIICQRGVSAFDGFMQALTQFTADEPGEGAHGELLDALKRKTTKISSLRPRQTPVVSNYSVQASVSSSYITQTSALSDLNTEGRYTARRYSSLPEESGVQTSRVNDSVEQKMTQLQVADQRREDDTPRHMQGDSQVSEGVSVFLSFLNLLLINNTCYIPCTSLL